MPDEAEDCRLCGEIAGDPGRDGIHQALSAPEDYLRRVVAESSSFVVLPSLGPIALGHVMVVPRRHVFAFAHLTSEEIEEASEMAEEIRVRGRRLGLPPFQVFEHGGARSGFAGPCVEHAHLQMIPVEGSVWPVLPSVKWEPFLTGLGGLPEGAGDGEYLYYEDPSGNAVLARAGAAPYPSQLMRLALATAADDRLRWNWQLHPRPEQADATFRLLVGA